MNRVPQQIPKNVRLKFTQIQTKNQLKLKFYHKYCFQKSTSDTIETYECTPPSLIQTRNQNKLYLNYYFKKRIDNFKKIYDLCSNLSPNSRIYQPYLKHLPQFEDIIDQTNHQFFVLIERRKQMGIPFNQYLKDRITPLSHNQVKIYLYQILKSLAVIHSKGIIHGDISTDCFIILNSNQGLSRHSIKLVQFKETLASSGTDTLANSLGHFQCPPFEKIQHQKLQLPIEHSMRIDSWGVGIIIAEMLFAGVYSFQQLQDNLLADKEQATMSYREKFCSKINQQAQQATKSKKLFQKFIINQILIKTDKVIKNYQVKEYLAIKILLLSFLSVDTDKRLDILGGLRFFKYFQSDSTYIQPQKFIEEELNNIFCRRNQVFSLQIMQQQEQKYKYLSSDCSFDRCILDEFLKQDIQFISQQLQPSKSSQGSIQVPYIDFSKRSKIVYLISIFQSEKKIIHLREQFQNSATMFLHPTLQQMIIIGGYKQLTTNSKTAFDLKHLNIQLDQKDSKKLQKSIPYGRAYASGCFISKNSYCIVGGFKEEASYEPLKVLLYNNLKSVWVSGPGINIQRARCSSIGLQSYIYVIGGDIIDKNLQFKTDKLMIERWQYPSEMGFEILNISDDHFDTYPNRSNAAIFSIKDNELLLFGGYDSFRQMDVLRLKFGNEEVKAQNVEMVQKLNLPLWNQGICRYSEQKDGSINVYFADKLRDENYSPQIFSFTIHP